MIGRRGLGTLLVALAAPAAAQEGPENREIVVTGRGLTARPGDKAFDIVEIDAGRIAANAAGRLESVLADVAGVQQFRRSDSRSANPTSQGISLRGIGGNASSRALLVLDGVPQSDPFGGWVAFPAYATDRIGLIRVTRGGGSGYLGPGALAGTVELESATPDATAPLLGRVAYGSRDAVDAQGSATLRRASGFATVSAAYARGDGFVPIVREMRGPADRAAPYEQASGAVRGVIGIGATTELQTMLSAFTDRRERGTAFTANKSEGADASVRLVGRGRWGWSALGYVQTRAFASQFASVDAGRTAAAMTLDQYNTPATGVGGRLEIKPPVGDGADLRLGVDGRGVSGRTMERYTFVSGAPTRLRHAGGRSRTVGAFADGSLGIGAVTLTAGGRVDRWRISGGFVDERTIATGAPLTDRDFAARQGTQWTGRTGVAWSPVPALTVRAAGYRGWRLPTLNELYRPFRVGADATAANADLAPETLTGVDGGIEVKPAAGMTLSATVFRNRLKSAIANITVGRGPGTFPGVGFVAAGGIYRVRGNLDAIRSDGVEIAASIARGPWFANGSLSLVDPQVVASGAAVALDGLRPAQTPRRLGAATLGWRQRGWAASATVRHSAEQFEDDQNLRRLAPATTVDAYAAMPVAGAWAIEVRAENLANDRVEAGISGNGIVERATPRTIWVGVRFGGG